MLEHIFSTFYNLTHIYFIVYLFSKTKFDQHKYVRTRILYISQSYTKSENTFEFTNNRLIGINLLALCIKRLLFFETHTVG